MDNVWPISQTSAQADCTPIGENMDCASVVQSILSWRWQVCFGLKTVSTTARYWTTWYGIHSSTFLFQ